VVADLQAAGHAVVRVAGTNRFETAVEIARRTDALLELLNGIPSGSAPTFLADGRSFQDALIAGAAAARTGGVLVLTEGSAMPAATASYLDGRSADELAIGSPATTARPSAGEKITGASPAQLSRRVLEQLGLAAGTVAVASEDVFADALAGGAHVGGLGPLLLTDGHTASDDLRAALEGQDGLRDVVLYGGTAAISSGVEQAIRTAVGA
ncbi:MAG TPA: cell wall-binding repeat-containing protein, partial [Acidimicrobiales bacterium]|nr:cell wall-binding repeat-containing protein [Acidimicrobiales bacterium]